MSSPRRRSGQIADHTSDVIGKLTRKPAVMGHSTGGLLTQIIAGRELSAASGGNRPRPFRRVLAFPISALSSAMPVLRNPLNRGRASYKKQRRNEGITQIEQMPNRGHALTIDHGWREVADRALAFVRRFV